MSGDGLASILNEFYVSVNSDIPPLDNDSLPTFLPHRNDFFIIESYEVCNKLRALKTRKAAGPDEISNQILEELAHILVDPITTIFNLVSYHEFEKKVTSFQNRHTEDKPTRERKRH